MRLGLVSDIHADHRALVRALDILADHGADRVVCLGDMVEKGPDGDRVVATLREHLVVCVRGNHDDNAVRRYHDGDDGDDLLRDPDAVAFLAGLPAERTACWDGVYVVLSHIAPAGQGEPVLPEQVPKRLLRALRGYDADLVLLGHTHRPTYLRHGQHCFINPGSVAGARARDSHTCAIVELPSLAFTLYSLDTGQPVLRAP